MVPSGKTTWSGGRWTGASSSAGCTRRVSPGSTTNGGCNSLASSRGTGAGFGAELRMSLVAGRSWFAGGESQDVARATDRGGDARRARREVPGPVVGRGATPDKPIPFPPTVQTSGDGSRLAVGIYGQNAGFRVWHLAAGTSGPPVALSHGPEHRVT